MIQKIKSFLKDAIGFYFLALARVSAEASADISRIEAARASETEQRLRVLVPDEAEREKIRESAIALAQQGIYQDDLVEMARVYSLIRTYGFTSDDLRLIGLLAKGKR